MKLRNKAAPSPAAPCPPPGFPLATLVLVASLLCSAPLGFVLYYSALPWCSTLPWRAVQLSSVHRPQSVSPGAAGEQSSWRAEHSWSNTTPGLLCHMTAVGLKSVPRNSPDTKQRQVQCKLFLDFSTLVGMDHGSTGGRTLHKVEINNAINSMQCGATQCHAMHAPTWCLGAFYSLFAMHLKSEPKNVLSHAPINSKVTGTMLGIRFPGPPSRDVLFFQGFFYHHY